MKLKNKVCIITGATSGMGKAIAESFSNEGAQLVLSGRNAERGNSLAERLPLSVFVAGDVSEPAYNEKLVNAAVALMKQMAVDYAPKIRINAICPGPVDTPFYGIPQKLLNTRIPLLKMPKNATLIKRLGSPEDIAKLTLFLASEDASWITGTAMTIDAGILNA